VVLDIVLTMLAFVKGSVFRGDEFWWVIYLWLLFN
jgi:hypothetical protein